MFFRVFSRRRAMMAALALLLLLVLVLTPFLWQRAQAVFFPAETRALPVLMYHSLLRSSDRWGRYVVAPAQLEADLAELRTRGYVFVSMAQIIDFVDGKGDLPEHPILLTLDDGYLNNMTYLPEILERQDACAVIAVVGEYVDIFTAQSDPNPNYAHMSWDELAAFAASPRIELANHSYYFHHQGSRRGASRAQGESRRDWSSAFSADTVRMQRALEAHCGVVPQVYAYPYGQMEDGGDGLLRDMGFRASFSCEERINLLTQGDADCLWALGRFNRPSGASAAAFADAMLAKES